jgi:hypothetical protein
MYQIQVSNEIQTKEISEILRDEFTALKLFFFYIHGTVHR